jgi:hypothetical protein
MEETQLIFQEPVQIDLKSLSKEIVDFLNSSEATYNGKKITPQNIKIGFAEKEAGETEKIILLFQSPDNPKEAVNLMTFYLDQNILAEDKRIVPAITNIQAILINPEIDKSFKINNNNKKLTEAIFELADKAKKIPTETILVRNFSYEQLNEKEQQLYQTYEKFRENFESKLDEASNKEKPILVLSNGAAEDNPSKELSLNRLFLTRICLENQFENIAVTFRSSKKFNDSFDEKYNKNNQTIDNLDSAPSSTAYIVSKLHKERYQDTHNSDFAADYSIKNIGISADYIATLNAKEQIQKSVEHSIEALQSSEAVNTYAQTTFFQMKAICESPALNEKFTIIPVNLLNYDLPNAIEKGEFKDEVSFTNDIETFFDKRPNIITSNNNDYFELKKYIEKLSYSELDLLTRKFSKIYNDRHNNLLNEFREIAFKEISETDNSPKVIDQKEFIKLTKLVESLNNDYGYGFKISGTSKDENNFLKVDFGKLVNDNPMFQSLELPLMEGMQVSSADLEKPAQTPSLPKEAKPNTKNR